MPEDTNADWGSQASEGTQTAYLSDGTPYTTTNEANDTNFYDASMWMMPSDTLSITNPTDNHYGVQELCR